MRCGGLATITSRGAVKHPLSPLLSGAEKSKTSKHHLMFGSRLHRHKKGKQPSESAGLSITSMVTDDDDIDSDNVDQGRQDQGGGDDGTDNNDTLQRHLRTQNPASFPSFHRIFVLQTCRPKKYPPFLKHDGIQEAVDLRFYTGAWGPQKEELGEGLAEKVGEGLAKGWRKVGKGLANVLASCNVAIPETPV